MQFFSPDSAPAENYDPLVIDRLLELGYNKEIVESELERGEPGRIAAAYHLAMISLGRERRSHGQFEKTEQEPFTAPVADKSHLANLGGVTLSSRTPDEPSNTFTYEAKPFAGTVQGDLSSFISRLKTSHSATLSGVSNKN